MGCCRPPGCCDGRRCCGRDRGVEVGRGISNERKADARWRADEHLKTIHALIIEWSQVYFHDRPRSFPTLMALRRELQIMTAQEGPLPRCIALANHEPDHAGRRPRPCRGGDDRGRGRPGPPVRGSYRRSAVASGIYRPAKSKAEPLVLPGSRRDVLAFPHMARRERETLEHAVHTIAEQATKADELVDEAKAPAEATSGHRPREDAPARATPREGRPRARARDLVAELHEVWSRRALGERSRRQARTLGSPGACSARGVNRLDTPRSLRPSSVLVRIRT